jgi:rhamnulokinase
VTVPDASAPPVFAAVDLGASSGRVILGQLDGGRLDLTEVARFPNGPVELDDGLHWDADRLGADIVAGLREAVRTAPAPVLSVGVDTWGVDYGRLDVTGDLLEPPFNYRDSRTDGVAERLFADLPAADLYAAAGLQVLPFNTIFQVVAQAGDPRWPEVTSVLLMPDLFSHRLGGRPVAEVTIASTTGLLDVRARRWSEPTLGLLAARYGLPLPRVLPALVEPGTVTGTTPPSLLGAELAVVAVAGHDTASAVVSIPCQEDDFAFISSGTWSLVGLELPEPVLTEASRQANFTNELGPDHTVRYLKNVMGLWVLNEAIRTWTDQGLDVGLTHLLAAAAERPALGLVVDIDDESLLPPGDMPARLAALAARTGQVFDPDPVAVTRCIMDSLALAYRRTIAQGARLSGRNPKVVQIVGGGSQNTLLCQLTAEATGLPVVAGPVEGTALGSILVQARALGVLEGPLSALREVARASCTTTRYEPGRLGLGDDQWEAAARRLQPGGAA